ncbi:hypothetical protein [Sphingobium mellinum]|uniref:hypothetical protein n=1 Tax=Sphingobium mellinum TaxID=1387166 RepID=UPI0030EBA616
MKKFVVPMLFALAVPFAASAQDAGVAVSPPPVVRTLPASTLVSITPDAEISSKKVEVGEKVSFSVVNDVLDGGAVAIPRGSKVNGTITWKTGKAVGGKSGKFEVNFDSVTVGGRSYAMRGTHRQEGKGNTVAAVFATWLVSGRSAVMIPGQFVNAFTAEPITY